MLIDFIIFKLYPKRTSDGGVVENYSPNLSLWGLGALIGLLIIGLMGIIEKVFLIDFVSDAGEINISHFTGSSLTMLQIAYFIFILLFIGMILWSVVKLVKED